MNRFTPNQIQCFDNKLESVMGTIAHPHTVFTSHDRLRAIRVIAKTSSDEPLVEYLYSILTEPEYEQLKQIP
jgi:hypothetical protein